MIGAQLGAFFLALAVDWSLAVFGLLCLATVISSLLIAFSLGGSGLQKHLKDWFLGMIVSVGLSGGFQVIVRTIQSHLTLGGA